MIGRRLEIFHLVICASKFSYVEKLTEIMLSIILNILKNYTEIEFEDWEIISEILSFVWLGFGNL